MLRVCKYCGKEYEGDPGGSCCPDCAAAQRETTVRTRICTICGASFPGGPAARFCPACRAERRREQNRRFKRNGPQRPLGSTDYCVVCGKPYMVNGGRQHYCPKCAPEAIRRIDNAQSRKWNRENTTPQERRETRQAAGAEIRCAVCGKPFVPRDPSLTCSPECSAALHRLRNKVWEQTNREARNDYHRQKTKAKLDAMTPEERERNRAEVNAKWREAYRKRQERKRAASEQSKDATPNDHTNKGGTTP